MQGEGKERKPLFINASGNYHKGLLSPKFAATLSKLKYAKLFRVNVINISKAIFHYFTVSTYHYAARKSNLGLKSAYSFEIRGTISGEVLV